MLQNVGYLQILLPATAHTITRTLKAGL